MPGRKINNRIITTLLFLLGFSSALHAATPWYDTFYQYRIPIDIACNESGWNVIPVTEQEITEAIGHTDPFIYNPKYLAYNHLVVVDEQTGQACDNAGFHCVPVSEELVKEQGGSLSIPTQKGAYYLVTYRASGYKGSPLGLYNQIYPLKTAVRKNEYLSSYESQYLPLTKKTHERLLLSDGSPLIVSQNQHAATVSDVSIKQVRIVLLAKFDQPGQKRLALYYQPLCGHYLKVPSKKTPILPNSACSINRIGQAEKYTQNTLYTLADTDDMQVWFTETTVRLQPGAKAPKLQKERLRIACAQNEAQSFQIVIKPKKKLEFKTATLRGLPVEETEVYKIEYVPIVTPSFLTPATIKGKVGDPLVALKKEHLQAESENLALFFTVRTTERTRPGVYNGELCLGFEDDQIVIPLNLNVYNFTLPEYSPFQSSMGGQYFATPGLGKNSILDYHGLSTREDLKTLSNKYYDIMVKNKFSPKCVLMHTEIPFKWHAPPVGYNIDKPGNFFELTDYDETTEITVKQFDRLLLDYYGALARNLQKHGWLDKCYINFDLTPDMDRMNHFVGLLQSDPVTRQIKMVALLQNTTYLGHPPDGPKSEFKYHDKIKFMPNMDENYNFWESHLFSDYDIKDDYRTIWGRSVNSSRMSIDSPGINNRMIALDIFNKKGSGYFITATIDWGSSGGGEGNPWVDPSVRFGNGALAYFYPPGKEGISSEPDWDVVPSARIMTFRESVDDYEYAFILKDLIDVARKKSIDVKHSESVLMDEFDGALSKKAGQDAVELAEYVDIFSPMMYQPFLNRASSWVGNYTHYLKKVTGKSVWPCLQATPIKLEDHDDLPPFTISTLRKNWMSVVESGANGISLYGPY